MNADPQLMERGPVPASLKRFIWDIQSMVELADSEREILLIGGDLMARLVASDDWLPLAYAVETPGAARQFQLYSDGEQRFTVAATILSGGAALSVSQPAIWEIVGVLRGAVTRTGGESDVGRRLPATAVDAHRSATADAIRLANALGDGVSICIHVYGGEIGRLIRHSVSPDGRMDEEPSPYANSEAAPPYDIFTIQTEIQD